MANTETLIQELQNERSSLKKMIDDFTTAISEKNFKQSDALKAPIFALLEKIKTLENSVQEFDTSIK